MIGLEGQTEARLEPGGHEACEGLFMVVGTHFHIFACCGLVGNPYLTSNIYGFCSPSSVNQVLVPFQDLNAEKGSK